MAVLTLKDWKSVLDPNGSVARIIEIIAETNELDEVMFKEGNLPTGNRTTIRAGYPTPTWRKLNYGVPNTKARSVQVDDTCGMLEDYSLVDKALADLEGNVAAFRLQEAKAHIQGMREEFASVLFYGDTSADPEKFMGFAPRFNSLSADNADNIIDGGGSGSDNYSVWLVVWSDTTAHCIFPKGSKVGLQHEDKGQVTAGDDTTGYYEAYRDHFKWDIGLTVRDWRYVVRIANIDSSDLTKDASGSSADLIDLMVQATEIPPSLNGRAAFYCNKTIRSFLRRQILNRSNVNLTFDTVAGKRVLAFDGIPVRRCDALVNESVVS